MGVTRWGRWGQEPGAAWGRVMGVGEGVAHRALPTINLQRCYLLERGKAHHHHHHHYQYQQWRSTQSIALLTPPSPSQYWQQARCENATRCWEVRSSLSPIHSLLVVRLFGWSHGNHPPVIFSLRRHLLPPVVFVEVSDLKFSEQSTPSEGRGQNGCDGFN